MTRRLFLDFDGTLIDSRLRLYNLFCELAPETTFSFDDYWTIKRNNIRQAKLLQSFLGYSDERIATFRDEWMAKVEESARLENDTAIEGAANFLERASTECELCLVTGRQHLDRLLPQLKKFGYFPYFSNILNTAQQTSKAELIRSSVSYGTDDILVGDTGDDIKTGKELGIRTVAVKTGALNEETLLSYHPDYILESVVNLKL